MTTEPDLPDNPADTLDEIARADAARDVIADYRDPLTNHLTTQLLALEEQSGGGRATIRHPDMKGVSATLAGGDLAVTIADRTAFAAWLDEVAPGRVQWRDEVAVGDHDAVAKAVRDASEMALDAPDAGDTALRILPRLWRHLTVTQTPAIPTDAIEQVQFEGLAKLTDTGLWDTAPGSPTAGERVPGVTVDRKPRTLQPTLKPLREQHRAALERRVAEMLRPPEAPQVGSGLSDRHQEGHHHG